MLPDESAERITLCQELDDGDFTDSSDESMEELNELCCEAEEIQGAVEAEEPIVCVTSALPTSDSISVPCGETFGDKGEVLVHEKLTRGRMHNESQVLFNQSRVEELTRMLACNPKEIFSEVEKLWFDSVTLPSISLPHDSPVCFVPMIFS